MRITLTIIMASLVMFAFAQQMPSTKVVPRNIQQHLDQGVFFQPVAPFSETVDPSRLQIPEEVKESGWGLLTDEAVLQTIVDNRPAYLKVTIPAIGKQDVTVLLYQANVTAPGFKSVYSDGMIEFETPGVHYRGMIEGDENSLVSFSFFRDHVMAIVSDSQGDFVLGPLENQSSSGIHLFYDDRSIESKNPFTCGMEELDHSGVTRPDEQPGGQRSPGDCVKVYWEVNYNVYQDKGVNTLSYITGLLNQVYILYANYGIEVTASEIFIWNTPSPYTGPNSGNFLDQFRNAKNGVYNGDLAHLLGYGGGGGVAYLDVLCNKYWGVAYSGITGSYNNVPTYSWSVMVTAHELGHNLSSPHTHSCNWNGNNTRLDNCGGNAGYPEGNCNNNPPDPPTGGTVMSYCHLRPVGINLAEGFGTQPATLILNRINAVNCLTTCGAAPCTFTITCPPNTTVNCGPNPLPASSGNATIQITSGSCSPTLSYSDNNAGLILCNGTGSFIRTFSATDNGNTQTCSQTITKVDNTPPVISGTANNLTINCNSPVPAAPILTASDNCGPASIFMTESISGTTCGYTITRLWTASDDCGNTSTRQQVVNVVDTTPPIARCKSGHKVYLNQAGEATLSPGDIDDGSSDACSSITLAVAPTTLTCANLGNAPVTLIVTDGCNNVGTCNTTVEVIDALKPHMACKGLDIYLDDTGNPVSVDPADIDNGVTDNCGVILLELSQTTFGCDDIGENNVKLIARDLSDNSNECSATIRVYDLIPPTFSYFPPDVTVYCTEDEASEEPIAADNCEVVSTGMTDSQELVPGGPAGSYLVRRSWWAVDKAGNDVTAEQRVVVLPDGQMVTLCNDNIVTAPSKAPVQAYWDAPKVDDICNGSYAMTQMEGPASGSYFNPGTRTRITYGYQDSWGTRYECAFHVEVPGINDDYQVHIQQADADCGDHLIESCTISDVSGASLNWTPKGSGIPVEYSLQPGATLEKYANGTALLTGSWRDAGGTNGWDGTLWFHHRRSYDGWTQAGGQANQPSADVDNWQFFEVNASASLFAGVGNLDTMRIQASPNHVGKGLQLGNGANGSPGQGGWCAIAGRNMNNVFVGRGELAFNQNCSNTNLIVDAAEVVSLNGADFPTTWLNGVMGPELGNAAPGNWSVQVEDENGQVHNHTFALVAPTGCTLLWEDACRELNSTWEATAWQISTYQNGSADRAVDGNTDGDFGNGSVTSTLAGWQNWWSADLQGNYNIESVRIWPRTDGNHSGLDPFYVLVSADPIPDLAPEQLLTTAGIRAIRHEGPMNEAWRMPVGLTGRYIKVQLAEEGRLMLAEVEALVCQDDRLDPIPGAPIWPNGPGNANGDKVATVSDLAAWPNPASDELNIYIHQSRVAATSVTILSMTGQQVYRQDLPDAREHQLRIPVGQWLSGMYTVVLSGTEGIQTQWVQVQH